MTDSRFLNTFGFCKGSKPSESECPLSDGLLFEAEISAKPGLNLKIRIRHQHKSAAHFSGRLKISVQTPTPRPSEKLSFKFIFPNKI
ncbi:hypothetical protein [Neisseria sp. CCUG12390]|uniref:hypothetical protein n=1 Tax=Neisseria sp. CCUG12390 TaxID=3392035 RepID=UPI003A0FDE89